MAVVSDYLLHNNFNYNKLKGLGSWRQLYIEILSKLPFKSIIEIGSGDPGFLSELNHFETRVGVDANPLLKGKYDALGVDFFCYDIESYDLENIGKFDVVVCSDVFEHLLNPLSLLMKIERLLNYDGILISHVPNEFDLYSMLKVMFAGKESVVWHKDSSEFDNPHLRRFTNTGYKKFLSECFKYNVSINSLLYGFPLKFLYKHDDYIPYCLQKGPTYISTNSIDVKTRFNDMFMLG